MIPMVNMRLFCACSVVSEWSSLGWVLDGIGGMLYMFGCAWILMGMDILGFDVGYRTWCWILMDVGCNVGYGYWK